MQFLIPLKNAVPQLLDLTGRHGQRLKKWTRHWWLKQYPLVKPHRGLLQCHCQCSQGGIYTQCFILVKGDWVEYKWSSLVFYCFFTIRTLWVFLFVFYFFFCISRCQFIWVANAVRSSGWSIQVNGIFHFYIIICNLCIYTLRVELGQPKKIKKGHLKEKKKDKKDKNIVALDLNSVCLMFTVWR